MRVEIAAISPGVVDLRSPTCSAWEEKGTGDLDIEMGVLTEEEKEKKAKEKKKLMEIIGKVLAKINSKEQREKAKKVLGSIVEKSEVRSRYKILHEL